MKISFERKKQLKVKARTYYGTSREVKVIGLNKRDSVVDKYFSDFMSRYFADDFGTSMKTIDFSSSNLKGLERFFR